MKVFFKKCEGSKIRKVFCVTEIVIFTFLCLSYASPVTLKSNRLVADTNPKIIDKKPIGSESIESIANKLDIREKKIDGMYVIDMYRYAEGQGVFLTSRNHFGRCVRYHFSETLWLKKSVLGSVIAIGMGAVTLLTLGPATPAMIAVVIGGTGIAVSGQVLAYPIGEELAYSFFGNRNSCNRDAYDTWTKIYAYFIRIITLIATAFVCLFYIKNCKYSGNN